MRWPGIVDVFGPFLRKTEVFTNDKHWEDLHTRVIEHVRADSPPPPFLCSSLTQNVRVIAKYYTRITLARLTTLLDLTPQQAEETLCRLVVAGTVWARIDRPAGIVNFRNKRSAEDVMNDWSSDMQKLLGLVEKTWMGVNAAQAAQTRTKV
jgi:26S proteasome regulatory subunit N5